jgi:hypothetical protein
MCHRTVKRASLLLIALLGWATVAQCDEGVASVSRGIANSIHWQKQWFGESFGSECVKYAVRRAGAITVFLPSVGQDLGSQSAPSRQFAAYIEGTNVLYSGRLWPGKASAEPSLGNPDGCRPGEIADHVRFSAERGIVLNAPFIWTPGNDPRPISGAESALVEGMVLRSITADYVAHHRPEPKQLRLADYRRSDPLLLVLDETQQKLYCIDFPPIETITENTVEHVYSGGIFLGPDATSAHAARVRKYVLSRVTRRSKRLGDEAR